MEDMLRHLPLFFFNLEVVDGGRRSMLFCFARYEKASDTLGAGGRASSRSAFWASAGERVERWSNCHSTNISDVFISAMKVSFWLLSCRGLTDSCWSSGDTAPAGSSRTFT